MRVPHERFRYDRSNMRREECYNQTGRRVSRRPFSGNEEITRKELVLSDAGNTV